MNKQAKKEYQKPKVEVQENLDEITKGDDSESDPP